MKAGYFGCYSSADLLKLSMPHKNRNTVNISCTENQEHIILLGSTLHQQAGHLSATLLSVTTTINILFHSSTVHLFSFIIFNPHCFALQMYVVTCIKSLETNNANSGYIRILTIEKTDSDHLNPICKALHFYEQTFEWNAHKKW